MIRQGGEEFEETGSFNDFIWHTRNRRTNLSLYSDDELLAWMTDPTNGGSVTEARGPEVRRRPDGQFQIDWSGWRIEVKFGRDETRVTISARSVEGSSEEREGRYVLRLRTSVLRPWRQDSRDSPAESRIDPSASRHVSDANTRFASAKVWVRTVSCCTPA